MKTELSITMNGKISLEVIAENQFEFALLNIIWKQQGYRRANGNTIAPDGGKTGFYIPFGRITSEEDATVLMPIERK